MEMALANYAFGFTAPPRLPLGALSAASATQKNARASHSVWCVAAPRGRIGGNCWTASRRWRTARFVRQY
jgi:hypothetical protein